MLTGSYGTVNVTSTGTGGIYIAGLACPITSNCLQTAGCKGGVA